MEGVHLVLTGRELAETIGPVITVPGTELPGIASVPRRVLATDKVRFVGEAVAIVVAESRYTAEDAAELVEVDWQPLPAVVDPEQAVAPGAPTLHNEVPDNNLGELSFATEHIDEIFASATHIFSKRLSCGRHQAAPIETRGAVGDWDPIAERGTLWTSNQMPHLVRSLLPIPFGISEQHFRVIAPDVGGGFGNKSNLFMEDIATLCASRALGTPVKSIEDRSEHLAASTHGKETLCELEMALDAGRTHHWLRGRLSATSAPTRCPAPGRWSTRCPRQPCYPAPMTYARSPGQRPASFPTSAAPPRTAVSECPPVRRCASFCSTKPPGRSSSIPSSCGSGRHRPRAGIRDCHQHALRRRQL